jgi:hypothetical protein
MIRSIIEGIVLSTTGIQMVHGEKAFLNLVNDRHNNADVIHIVDPIKLKINETTFMQEGYPLTMLFLSKSKLDDNPTQIVGLTDPRRLKMRAFLAGLRDSNLIQKPITNIEALETYHMFDADYSGWMLFITVKPMNSGGVC